MKRNETRTIALLGMMSAFVFAGNYARIVLPVPVGGVPSFTLANLLCVLSGLLMGPVGGLAAGLGSALYDLTNPLWAAECWITFFTKGMMGLSTGLVVRVGRNRHGPGYAHCLAAATTGCVCYYILYYLKAYFYNGLLLGGLEPGPALFTLLELIPTTLFNGGIALIAAPPLALALHTALDRAGFRRPD